MKGDVDGDAPLTEARADKAPVPDLLPEARAAEGTGRERHAAATASSYQRKVLQLSSHQKTRTLLQLPNPGNTFVPESVAVPASGAGFADVSPSPPGTKWYVIVFPKENMCSHTRLTLFFYKKAPSPPPQPPPTPGAAPRAAAEPAPGAAGGARVCVGRRVLFVTGLSNARYGRFKPGTRRRQRYRPRRRCRRSPTPWPRTSLPVLFPSSRMRLKPSPRPSGWC